MTTGLEKLFEAREKCIDEPLRTPITLRALGPIEHYEGTAHCEGRDFLAGLNQPRIIAGRKSRWQIGFGEFAFERNGEEMETPLTLEFGYPADWTARNINRGLDLSGAQTLIRAGLVIGRELRLYAELVEMTREVRLVPLPPVSILTLRPVSCRTSV